MSRNVYKLKVALDIGEDEDIESDFYLDVNTINSFYIPMPHDLLGAGITLEYGSSSVTVKQEPHILKYLRENFADQAVTLSNY